MSDDVLTLFTGLTNEQAQELRRQIMPTLLQLRRKIISEMPPAKRIYKRKKAEDIAAAITQPPPQA